MNCNKCPHLDEIKAALKACANCDAGKLSGTVHIDAAPDPVLVLSKAASTDHTPQDAVTALDPDTEDKLRKCLFILADFTPVELLFIRNALLGQQPIALRAVLLDLREKLTTKYGLDGEDTALFRSVSYAWKHTIERKLPPLKKLFDSVIHPKTVDLC